MQYNQWKIIRDQLPAKSPFELKDNSSIPKTEFEEDVLYEWLLGFRLNPHFNLSLYEQQLVFWFGGVCLCICRCDALPLVPPSIETSDAAKLVTLCSSVQRALKVRNNNLPVHIFKCIAAKQNFTVTQTGTESWYGICSSFEYWACVEYSLCVCRKAGLL